MINREIFKKLSNIHDLHCVSIYIPKSADKKDRIRLKNAYQDADRQLKAMYDLDERERKARLEPLQTFINEVEHFRYKRKGLALFLYGKSKMSFYYSDKEFQERVYVANHLYLLPLSDSIRESPEKLLLKLSAEEVVLYSFDEKKIRIHPLDKKLPKNINDTVGYDYEQKSLQFRSGQQGNQKGMYHGQGAGNDPEKKKEYEAFFREIDTIINDYVVDKSAKLYLACVDYLYPIYREVSTYPSISEYFLQGNYDEFNSDQIHQKILGILIKNNKEEKADVIENFKQNLGTKKVSQNPEEIIPACVEGKVRRLLIDPGHEIWGKYLEEKNRIEIDEVRNTPDTSLLDFAARKCIENAGEVRLVNSDEEKKLEVINAVYRYTY